MSALQVSRVLKKIKDEYYDNKKKYPKYYAPFLDDPADCDMFDLITLFEELEKRKNIDYCLHVKKLYKYLLQDKSEHVKNSYIEELQRLL